jgi:HTH-type transcriptional regulator/antitoxin HigA
MKRRTLDEKKYGALLSKALPHVIHNDDELEAFTNELLSLDELINPSLEENELAELLTTLIEKYESENYPIRQPSPGETIKFLLGQRGLSEKHLWSVIGSKSHTSEILNGKRGIGKAVAGKLAEFFHVDPEVFVQLKTMTAGSSGPHD